MVMKRSDIMEELTLHREQLHQRFGIAGGL